MFEKVVTHVSFPQEEEKVLAFWEDMQTFEKSLENRRGCKEYVFYDGPPFATGLPHYGHLLAGTIKDVIPRYQTMNGRYVDRVFGWDCHGLPVEYELSQELGLNSKHEIEEYGIAKYNEACREIVLRYTGEWEQFVKRIGRWVDFEHGYRTMDKDYMESIWWVFKELWDKGLIYEGHKILPYCPKDATPLSNFEANQGYQDVQDPAITVSFQLRDEPGVKVLAWTTTPWTLPSNLALTVHEDVDYVYVRDGENTFVMAEARVSAYYPDEAPETVKRVKGKDLVGLQYEPLFPYFESMRSDGAFKIISADFVTTADGTGVVHTAPGFGEDDAEAGRLHGVPAVCPIDAECRFTSDVPDYEGRFVKDCDSDIMRRLKDEGKLVHRSTHQHSYPHCWRCESPLIYRAISTWFVDIGKVKDKMLNANSQIHWVPEHIKGGRFGNWLENARDWAISRNRYWGCPLPIWRNEETGETLCLGSIGELEARTGATFDDIHKHFVDPVIIEGETGPLTRVPEVLDCWFESGSMPYAQRHYPFDNKDWLDEHFPADFIAEGLDQTRGWFYTLVVLGAALFDRPPFKNVVVNGMILAEDGRKMSKRLKNYPNPMDVMNLYGADALRLNMLSSPVVRGENVAFSEKGVQETMRSVILPLWNSYSFLVTYARVDNWHPDTSAASEPAEHPLDRWIRARLNHLVRDVRKSLDHCHLQIAALQFATFIDDLTNWYIRRSRRRFWKSDNDGDKLTAYATLYHVLLTLVKALAPFAPFVTETIYRNLRSADMPESVHLCDYPTVLEADMDEILERRMAHTRTAVSLGRHLRSQANARTRQPLRKAILVSMHDNICQDMELLKDIVMDELNVKTVEIRSNEEEVVHLSAKANFKSLGSKLGKNMKAAAAKIMELSFVDIQRLRAGESISMSLDGIDPFDLALEDILIQREEKEGMAVANEGDITVALDLHLDADLKREGLAREMVHVIQNLRKENGFDVSDRITITYSGSDEVAGAVGQFQEYIQGETLCTSLERVDAVDGNAVDLEGHSVVFDVEKVA
jgi:isoleucyl-tRNA synthetase